MVKNLLSILSTRQNTILSGASILMVAVFASKLLGLIRDRMLVHNFNTTEAAIFFAAFKLPDLLFQLLIFGALSVAFIPIFTDHLNKKGEKDAFFFASNILNLSLLIFGVIAAISFIFTPQLNSIFVPGFTGAQKDLTDSLSRIILLAQLILIVGSFFIAISQSYQRFIIPALAPILYNIGAIFGIAVLAPMIGISGTAWGVVIGALMHAAIQIPLIKSLGFKYHFSFSFLNSGVREVVKMISIRNIGLAVEQINDAVGIALASLVSYSSITLLTFAQHLQVVPIGLFGATIAQAALPILSREQARGEIEPFKVTLLTTLHQILFLTLPAAAILIVLRIPVVRLVFGASQFNWTDTVLTGKTVAFFALGLAAQSVILLLVRAFYALKDTKTPVMVTIASVLINIFCSLLFIRGFGWDVWSLGLAYAFSGNLAFVWLLFFLNRKLGGFDSRALIVPGAKMFLAAIVSAIALYIPIKALDQLVFDTTKTINLLMLTSLASFFGLSVYILLVWLLEVKELATFVSLVKRVVNLRTKLRSKEMVEQPGSV